jgi:hypothetical protein
MDADNFWVLPEFDTGVDRQYWRCKRCPCSATCSNAAWALVKACSFICERAVRDAVFAHLVISGKHLLDHEAATLAAANAEIEVLVETSIQRAAYCRQMTKISETSAKNQPLDRRGENRKGSKCSSSQGGKGVAIGASSRAEDGSAIVRSKRPFEGEDMMNSQRLRMVMDSVDRARMAMQSAQTVLTNAAEKFQERSIACTQTVGALQDEHNVMSAARECMADMARDMAS